MIDYNMMLVAKAEYEERIRQIELERRVRKSQVRPVNRVLFGLGDMMVNIGSRLKTQSAPVPAPPTMTAGGHAR